MPFEFDEECLSAFLMLKEALISTPVMQAPNWELPFLVMSDASDYAVRTILGQRKDNKPNAIYYASRTLGKAQVNYATTKKDFLAVVLALEKFHSYLINSKVIIFSDHVALKRLIKKSNSKPRLIQWVLLLKEFDFEIKDKVKLANMVTNYLSRLGPEATPSEQLPIDDSFPNEQLLAISHQTTLWYVDLVNYKV